jgi:hypothetical protein
MLLVLSNAQSELSPLEIGVHTLEAVRLGTRWTGGGLTEYTRQIGKSKSYITEVRQAAEVWKAVSGSTGRTLSLLDKARHLFLIHAAPQDTWPLLVEAMLTGGWGREDTEAAVKRVNDLLAAVPGWWTVDRLSVTRRAGCSHVHHTGRTTEELKPLSLKSLLQICYRLSASATGFATSSRRICSSHSISLSRCSCRRNPRQLWSFSLITYHSVTLSHSLCSYRLRTTNL